MTGKKKLKRELKAAKAWNDFARLIIEMWQGIAMQYSKEITTIRSGYMATGEDDKRLEELQDETEDFQVGPL